MVSSAKQGTLILYIDDIDHGLPVKRNFCS